MKWLYSITNFPHAKMFFSQKPVEPSIGGLPAIECNGARGVSSDLLLYHLWSEVYEENRNTMQDAVIFVANLDQISLTPGTNSFVELNSANVEFLAPLLGRNKDGTRVHGNDSIVTIISTKFKISREDAAMMLEMVDDIASRGLRHLAIRGTGVLGDSFLRNIARLFNIKYVSASREYQVLHVATFVKATPNGAKSRIYGAGDAAAGILVRDAGAFIQVQGMTEQSFRNLQQKYFSLKAPATARFSDTVILYGCAPFKQDIINIIFPQEADYKKCVRAVENQRFNCPPITTTAPVAKKKLFRGRIVQAIKTKVADIRAKN